MQNRKQQKSRPRAPTKNGKFKYSNKPIRLASDVNVIRELERVILGTRQNVRRLGNSVRGRRPKNAGNGVTNDPLYRSLMGIISPFSGVRGTVSGLKDPRPSQKFSGRGLVSYGIPAGEEFMVFIYPCIANGINYPSMTLSYGTTANMALATSTYISTTVGATPLNITQIHGTTATPYDQVTLSNGQNNWRILSAGVRVRWTGANLYRGGLFKYYHDTRGDILNVGNLSSLTFAQIATVLDGHNGIVRHNLADIPELLINLPSVTDESQLWSTMDDFWPGNKEYTQQRIGGTTSSRLAGQPIGYLYGVNTTGQTMFFDAEMVEHWEISGRAVDALNTPSTGNAELGNSIQTLVVSAHQHLAHNPHTSYHSALKSVVRDPHVRSAFTGVASKMVTAAVGMLLV
jgi:hypothetical protein